MSIRIGIGKSEMRPHQNIYLRYSSFRIRHLEYFAHSHEYRADLGQSVAEVCTNGNFHLIDEHLYADSLAEKVELEHRITEPGGPILEAY